MNIDIILNFFYEKASQRIKTKINESGLKYIDISLTDSKLISLIVNNRRTKNNRFLITDAIISNYYLDKETKEYIKYGLLERLDFKNIKEILWGTDKEIENYVFDLFDLLWKYVYENESNYGINKDLFLSDYVPYAKYRAYWNILFSAENREPAILYGIFEDEVIENIDYAEEQALLFLYKKCQQEFLLKFEEFTKETLSFHKIDKIFKERFIEKNFVPLLKKHTPDSSSLGIRVRELINFDLSQSASLISNKIDDNKLYQSLLINASSKYILALENIQKTYFDN